MSAKVGDIVIPSQTAPVVEQLPQPAQLNPMQLIQVAVQNNVSAEYLTQLMELQRQWRAERAEEAFTKAMNAFRAESLQVVKKKKVEFGNTKYAHATLSDIVALAAPRLSAHGLSHRWETKQDGNAITVSCIVTHELGHRIQNSLTASPDTSGSKNSIQAIGSAVTYLQRYTFLAITGLAAKDDDGKAAEPMQTINEKQVADLVALCEDVGADQARLKKYLKIERFEEIPAQNYATVVAEVEAKRKAKR